MADKVLSLVGRLRLLVGEGLVALGRLLDKLGVWVMPEGDQEMFDLLTRLGKEVRDKPEKRCNGYKGPI